MPDESRAPMTRAVVIVASALALSSAEATTTSRVGTAAVAAVAASTPADLIRALDREDPLALADTTLPRLADLDAATRADLARRLAAWHIGRRVAAWAFLQVGTPYRLGPLGEEVPPDPDPLITFETTDCAVLNLVSAALAHAHEVDERRGMALANYRRGEVSYATRLHFTTDRLDASPYYRDITRTVGRGACRTREVVLNRKADGGRWIPIEWTRTRRVRYLPRSEGARFARWHDARRFPDAVGVAFVQEATLSNGLDVVHESLLWKGRTFLHASSATGRVVTMPWADFLAGPGRRYDGFVLFEYR